MRPASLIWIRPVRGCYSALFVRRRVVRAIEWVSRKTKAHLLPVRKSDVGRTRLVRNSFEIFGLEVGVLGLADFGCRRGLPSRCLRWRPNADTWRSGRAIADADTWSGCSSAHARRRGSWTRRSARRRTTRSSGPAPALCKAQVSAS